MQKVVKWILPILIGGYLLVSRPVPEHDMPPNTPWNVLMQAEGLAGTSPVLPDTLQRLVDRTILLTGFMIPLDPGRDHDRFMLSPYPTGCAFHAQGSPESMVEVLSDEAVRFSREAIAVRGRFALAEDEAGLRFQLHEARKRDLP